MSELEILSCPYCGTEKPPGGTNVVLQQAGSRYMVVCADCSAQGPHSDTKELAVSWWNESKQLMIATRAVNRALDQCDRYAEIGDKMYEELAKEAGTVDLGRLRELAMEMARLPRSTSILKAPDGDSS